MEEYLQGDQLRINIDGDWKNTSKDVGIAYIVRDAAGTTLKAVTAYH